jgi:multidrug efflux pump subunit AcrA (membrane-fusion protein)
MGYSVYFLSSLIKPRSAARTFFAFTLAAPGFLILAIVLAGCRAKPASTKGELSNLIILSAPSSGIVQRVLVGEGVFVHGGAPVIEIAIDAPPVPATRERDVQREARAQAQAARKGTARELQTEVERASVEVQRMESLVVQNGAPPAQLDAARAVYQQAQERLQQAQAGGGSFPATSLNEPRGALAGENLAAQRATAFVRATASGNVRVVNVRAGQRVAAGQPVATIARESR